jgi:archaellum component FlaC
MGGSTEAHAFTGKIDTLDKKVDNILDIVIFIKDSMGDQFNAVDNRFGQIDQQFHEVRNELGKVNNRLEYMNQEIKEVKQNIARVETKVDRIDKRSVEDTDVIVNDIANHEVRIVRLEEQYV